MHVLQKILKYFLLYSFYTTGCLAIPHHRGLTLLIRIWLLCWLSAAIFLMIYWVVKEGVDSVGDLVGSASFLLNALVNVIIILETALKSKDYHEMSKLKQEIDELFDQHLNVNILQTVYDNHLAQRIFWVLLCQLACNGVIIWVNCIYVISPVFWHYLFMSLSLHTRYIQIIVKIMTMNCRVTLLRQQIGCMVRRNETKSIISNEIWQPSDPKDYEKVNFMRLIYLRLWEFYSSFNRLYSWSLLTLFITSFFDIVCNCYWTYAAIYGQKVYQIYVMNAATSISLASLVCVLFYLTDASERNQTMKMPDGLTTNEENSFDSEISKMPLQDLRSTFCHHQNKFYKASTLLAYFGYWIFGLEPFFANKTFYLAYVLIWCCEVGSIFYVTMKYEVLVNKAYHFILLNIVLYFTYTLGHIIVLIESCATLAQRTLLLQQLSSVTQIVEEKLNGKQHLELAAARLGRVAVRVLALLVCVHCSVAFTTLNAKSKASFLYWISLQSYLALQLKTLEFLSGLLQLNYLIIIIRQLLNDLGERNLRRVFRNINTSATSKIIQVVALDEEARDEVLLKVLKSTLNDVYAIFQLYKETQGWSLLATTAVYFVNFFCNSYWVLVAILAHSRDYHSIWRNVSFASMAFVLLLLTCWYAQESQRESRSIGCLIPKLAKPLGNKYYNDLVSEFAVQTLHQRFTVTAKEFFSLNLCLLGKMVAAIVTYLVILIQFMMTETN